ncbi:MAG: CHAT domain-containing protein [Alphaproteobacteria bacterium]|nr:CHAT domain-containing protein [Alphaproteobacteria bacterium]
MGPVSESKLPPRGIGDIVALVERGLAEPAPPREVQVETILEKAAPHLEVDRLRQVARVALDDGRPQAAVEILMQVLQSAIRIYGRFNVEWLRYDQIEASAAAGDHREAMHVALDLADKARGSAISRSAAMARACIGMVATGNLSGAAQLIESSASLSRGSARSLTEFNLARCRGDLALARLNTTEARDHYRIARRYLRGIVGEAGAASGVTSRSGYLALDPRLVTRMAEDLNMREVTALIAEGRFAEAEVALRSAIVAAATGRDPASPAVAQLVATLGEVLAEQGRFADARRLARLALRAYRRAGLPEMSWLMLDAQVLASETLMAQRRWAEAAETFAPVYDQPTVARRYVVGQVMPVLLALKTGKAEAAEEFARELAKRNDEGLGANHPETLEARALHALARLRLAPTDRTPLAELARIVPRMLDDRASVDDESGKAGLKLRRQRSIAEAYMIEAAGDPGQAAPLLTLSDGLRYRTVDRAIGASAARLAAGNSDLAALARREQDLRAGIAFGFARLARLADQFVPPAQRSAMMAQIESQQREHGAVRERIAAAFPAYAALIEPRAPSEAELRAALRPHEAAVAFYFTPEGGFAWAVPKAGPLAFARLTVGQAELEAKVARLRAALEPDAATGEVARFDTALAHELYRDLLAPIEAGWKGAKSLIVVPHGALGALPLGLLATGPARASAGGPRFADYRDVPWLIRQAAVSQVPSLAAFMTLRRIPAGAAEREAFIGFGDPLFGGRAPAEDAGPSTRLAMRGVRVAAMGAIDKVESESNLLSALVRLPDTAEELVEIARILGADPARDVHLGAAANKAAVARPETGRRKVVAFATHGLVPGDIDGLTEPALALTPAAAGGSGDGLLTMSQVAELKLDADWVVLSACNTAAAQGAGAEAVSGLGRAFFYAGARSLLVSNWAVESGAARALTTALFRTHAADQTLERSESLRRVMVEMIDRGLGGEGSYARAHPLFWAPFSLIGDPAR